MLETPEPDPPFQPTFPAPQARWSLIDLVVFGAFFSVVVALLLLLVGRLSALLSNLLVATVLIQSVLLLLLVGFIWLLAKLRGSYFGESIHWYWIYPWTKWTLIFLGAGLALGAALVAALFPIPVETPLEKLLSSSKSLYVFAFFGIAVAPLLEEVIVRGFLFTVFEDIGGPRAAVAVTTGLFAVLHMIQLWGNWLAILVIFVVGYILARLRERSGSVIPGVIVHTAYNGTLFGMGALGSLIQKGLGPS